MKLSCDREKLLQAFQLAAGVAPSRSPKPILENIKLEARPEGVTLMATDLEVGIRIDVPGIEVAAPGDVVLPTKRVGPILRETSDERLSLESDGAKLRIRGERSEFQLPTQTPDEFPAVRPFEESKYHQLPARLLRELLRRTAFATDTESSRYALGGVLLELSETGIIAVGTDGRRLARQEGPAESVGGHVPKEHTVVPTRAIPLLDRGLVELAGGPFYSAVRQAAVVTSEEHRGVEFIFGGGKLVLTAHGAELGESRVELPIGYEGAETPVRLDPRFMGDFLRVLDPAGVITFSFHDAESAIVCTTGDGYAYVVMPLSREA